MPPSLRPSKLFRSRNELRPDSMAEDWRGFRVSGLKWISQSHGHIHGIAMTKNWHAAGPTLLREALMYEEGQLWQAPRKPSTLHHPLRKNTDNSAQRCLARAPQTFWVKLRRLPRAWNRMCTLVLGTLFSLHKDYKGHGRYLGLYIKHRIRLSLSLYLFHLILPSR